MQITEVFHFEDIDENVVIVIDSIDLIGNTEVCHRNFTDDIRDGDYISIQSLGEYFSHRVRK